MIYRIELEEELVEKLFEIVEFDTEPLDESSLVEGDCFKHDTGWM